MQQILHHKDDLTYLIFISSGESTQQFCVFNIWFQGNAAVFDTKYILIESNFKQPQDHIINKDYFTHPTWDYFLVAVNDIEINMKDKKLGLPKSLHQ